MQAVFRYTRGARAKKFLAPWRSVPANNINFFPGMSHSERQFFKDLVDSRIEMLDFTRAMVAQKIVDVRTGLGTWRVIYHSML